MKNFIPLIIVFFVGCTESEPTTLVRQTYTMSVINEYKTVSIPIETPDEALHFAIKENFFESFPIDDLKVKGYENFSITVLKRTPAYEINHYKKRHKNGLTSKTDLERIIKERRSIGNYWQVNISTADKIFPSYSCNYHLGINGETLFKAPSCGFNK